VLKFRGQGAAVKERDEAGRIIREFMENASQDEILELERLLKEREKRRRYSVPDPADMAKKLSSQIQNQMGLTNKNIKSMARELVIKLAREHKPDIKPDELRALVEQMVPSGSGQGKGGAAPVPREMMKTMIVQFILYSQGKMESSELETMPEGWVQKYWDAFTPNIRKLISVYIKGGIDKRSFWKRIREALGE